MPLLSDTFKRILLEDVVVDRSERQRRIIYSTEGKFLNADGLIESIRARGVYNPIIVTREHVLVAGERRLEASRVLGLRDIPVRFADELSPIEARIIELEENLKRSDLGWRDEVAAISALHDAYVETEPSWSQQKTANSLSYPETGVSMILRVAQDLEDPLINRATTYREAYNVLMRRDSRRIDDAITEITQAGMALFPASEGGARVELDAATGGEQPQPKAEEPKSIINGDFIEWAKYYEGQKFNFLHCDFPYGTNVFGGNQSGRTRWGTYDDQPHLYEDLITALCTNLDRLLAPSAHILFWLPADIRKQINTLEQFRQQAPDLIFWPKPVVWLKTDNVGIMQDPKRGPRHVYETALIATRNDRAIIRPTSDAYGAPTDKTYHPSAKPEPVLRYFMQMFIDENSRVLDPTCGGGSALRAAEALGAQYVLGVELDTEHYEAAVHAMKQFRTLRRAAGKVA
jgi:ParB/RepB/Spo0J family partition protein